MSTTNSQTETSPTINMTILPETSNTSLPSGQMTDQTLSGVSTTQVAKNFTITTNRLTTLTTNGSTDQTTTNYTITNGETIKANETTIMASTMVGFTDSSQTLRNTTNVTNSTPSMTVNSNFTIPQSTTNFSTVPVAKNQTNNYMTTNGTVQVNESTPTTEPLISTTDLQHTLGVTSNFTTNANNMNVTDNIAENVTKLTSYTSISPLDTTTQSNATLQTTSKLTYTSSMFTTREMNFTNVTTTNNINLTVFKSTDKPTSPTTISGNTDLMILGLPVWGFSLAVAGVAILLFTVLLLVVICCRKRRQKNIDLNRQKNNDMAWNPSGGRLDISLSPVDVFSGNNDAFEGDSIVDKAESSGYVMRLKSSQNTVTDSPEKSKKLTPASIPTVAPVITNKEDATNDIMPRKVQTSFLHSSKTNEVENTFSVESKPGRSSVSTLKSKDAAASTGEVAGSSDIPPPPPFYKAQKQPEAVSLDKNKADTNGSLPIPETVSYDTKSSLPPPPPPPLI